MSEPTFRFIVRHGSQYVNLKHRRTNPKNPKSYELSDKPDYYVNGFMVAGALRAFPGAKVENFKPDPD